ncbi:NAD(P)(+) transhydrogenase (Re/Si-specific) subunit beta [Desulfovibrio intestinalis]|uniref:proton-translocating NAD(P)(+) transhydrogenase n=1 Tax=Desulfovibrio intestinalis TaxID=58621 RepID=A0A7W8C0Y1_9BACT|nr:NAD(P)(+) transhydrogenase (Re/Si-specific) subunit beta [Desulfovibrio intestinalis]MBB5143573.1 NAD(P) transhydrogenase subunit beta [Desulfovibrio intestinalis]
MNALTYNIIAGLLVASVLFGLRLMNRVPTAVKGNLFCASAMGLAILVTMFKDGSLLSPTLWLAIAVGMTLGLTLSNKVKMIQMPQMVAFLHGIGGGAAAIVSFLVLTDTGAPSAFERGSACLALAMGMTTITGSFVAAGKLHQVLPQKPIILPDHTKIILSILGVMGFSVLMGTIFPHFLFGFFIFLMFLTGTAFGVGFTIRVGGADMPITISLLNSMGGVCAAIAGFAVNDPLLVAIGGIIGSSGFLLTRIMCKAMNRKLLSILLGESSVVAPRAAAPKAAAAPAQAKSSEADIAKLVQSAKKVVIVPGYGMALAQAQHKVKQLADLLESKGATVSYGIHPVAGRMPGHMNVLLAEANVDYENLLEMDVVNPMFADADLVIVVGANDVVNPAANSAEGTPIYGMPILDAEKAKNIIICNYDNKPGYAGVPNPLYERAGVHLMLGDAAKTFDTLLHYAQGNAPAAEGASSGGDSQEAAAAKLVQNAKNVVIVPGYGMALAQAQHKVKQLADALVAKGVKVSYGIHPVAGRMPGHMNVLLAEANVDYEDLLEMDVVNPMFADSDLVVVIGANDVVNPAANTAEGTPIYGMPILKADECKNIIICNYDDKPGYAGVPNPLYERDGVILMTGDAAKTVDRLVSFALGESPAAAAAASGGDSKEAAAASLVQNAKNVIIVPGYGMALAQAQYKVKQLADLFESKGAKISYGIHPVAGRMPGHMNVLLAEANVDYENLLEMDTVNPMFAEADLVIIVGANDVVNPAANSAEGTPIYGMPILKAEDAKNIIICNYDDKPGYAGVPNPLYERDGVILMTGDASKSFDKLLAYAHGESPAGAAPAAASASGGGDQVDKVLRDAKSVVIVPGYGMALAQAQHKVKQLADLLEAKGVKVSYGIHPVAGRMPGHMNVLLAEANVDYENLLEMDVVNPMFADADVAIVIGANDVVNPAANTAEGTPIYGMPILKAGEAKNVIICNYDDKPGYAGVDNTLYGKPGVIMMLGDASATMDKLIGILQK